jgi:tetratricopeptide (TPR) repeat protein
LVSPKNAASEEMLPLEQVKIYKRVIYEATLKIEKDDKDLEAYKVRGIAHYKLGELYKIVYGPFLTAERKEEIFDEFALAAKDFTSAIELQKDLYILYLYRGICYGWMGFSENALKDFNYAVKHDPKNADGYYLRGKEHWRRGEEEEAKVDYDKACELNPKYKKEYYER